MALPVISSQGSHRSGVSAPLKLHFHTMGPYLFPSDTPDVIISFLTLDTAPTKGTTVSLGCPIDDAD